MRSKGPTDRPFYEDRAKFANSSGSGRGNANGKGRASEQASKKKRLSAHTHDIYEGGGAHNPHTKEVHILHTVHT